MATAGTTQFICLFHDADHGRAALQALQSAGFHQNNIVVVGDPSDTEGETTNAASLDWLGVPERDRDHLQAGLRHGGILLSLQASEDRTGEIERIFHKYTAEKIDDEDTGTRDANMPVAAQNSETQSSQTQDAQTHEAQTRDAQPPVRSVDNAVVPIVQEDLVVGKREVDRGGVRVFRRVVEEPVSETLNLHTERVVIDRRPADRAVNDADLATGDRTIELTETAEVPVVTKTARVVEEVRVGVEATERTETFQDTVRHTEVEMKSVPEGSRSGAHARDTAPTSIPGSDPLDTRRS